MLCSSGGARIGGACCESPVETLAWPSMRLSRLRLTCFAFRRCFFVEFPSPRAIGFVVAQGYVQMLPAAAFVIQGGILSRTHRCFCQRCML